VTVKLLAAYRPDGTKRAVWSDRAAPSFRKAGVIPERASRVEVIRDGPNRGKFSVDFALLADLTKDERYRVCLARAFESYQEAVRAEVAWLEANWVLGGIAT
jgi:hypothetical protein